MDAGSLRFEVRKAGVHWLSAVGTVVEVVLEATSGGGGNPGLGSYGKPPAVIAYNRNGDHLILEEAHANESAEERMSVIREDFKTMATDEWCDRYSVNPSFVSG